jgi:uncharacterized phage protein (TIGR01671 family)
MDKYPLHRTGATGYNGTGKGEQYVGCGVFPLPRSKGKEGEGEMREILFRGKRVDNGEWIEGGIIFVKHSPFVCYELAKGLPKLYEVIYETVGQYTGLDDRSGKKIFEGDILQQYKDVWLNGHRTGKLRELCKFVVEWDESYAGFIPCIYRNDDREKYNFNENCCIVIGNIHDNPELLHTSKNDEVRE